MVTLKELENAIRKWIEEQNIKVTNVAVNYVTEFLRGLSTNSKKGTITLTLQINDDVLVKKGDVRKWKGQLLLVWLEFEEKKEFKYV